MPAVGAYNNTSAIFRAAVPQRSYAQLSAMKDRQMYLAGIQEERARLSQQENQKNIELQQDTFNKIRNMPFEAPDKQRIGMWLRERQKELAKHLEKNYPNREEDFFKNELSTWLKNTAGELYSSDLFAMATNNKENVFYAKQAIADNKNLTGTFDQNGNYKSAESALLDFMQGKTTTFRYNGSYKPDGQFVYDHFAKMDNPNGSRYDRNAFASGQDVLNLVTSRLGDTNGRDMYYRMFQGRSVPYKRYSLEDQALFNLDVANKQSMMDARRQANARGWASLDIQRQKAANEQEDRTRFDQGIQSIVQNPIGTTPYMPITASPDQKLRTIGKTLRSITSQGKTPGARNFEQLSGIPLGNNAGMEFTELSGLNIGPLHTKYANLTKGSGKVQEGIMPDGTVLDFSKIPHKVSSVNPNIFIDQVESNRIAEDSRTKGSVQYPDHEFRKATVFVKLADVKSNGIDITDAVPHKTTAKKDQPSVVDGYFIDIMTPSKGFFNNKEIQNMVNKGMFGQKRANDILDQGVDEFESDNDLIFDN